MASYSDLFDYSLSITLICKQCETEWVPENRGRGYGAHLQDDGKFEAHITIPDAKCPVCNALDNMISEFKEHQLRRRNY